ncbi:MAG: DNA polymerase I [Proteobacteria bacterium]|nr:DNA polymerase I [Pseudomonadota bacterium]
MAQSKLIIIDGSSYFFRAFFAIQRLTNSKGFPTNAIYGFTNMLIKVLEVEKPENIIIAFDTPKPSFRKEIYPEYKANREKPPEDLVKQIPEILKMVDAFNIKRIQLEGAEADDVIGTVAERAVKAGYAVDIITGDKDLLQLVGPQVTLYDTMKDKRVGPDGVVEKLGVRAEQVVDFLALMGDASDNIPGVNGIGEKTAAELISTFGSLENLYNNLDKIKQEKRRETLKKEKEIAFLSKKLATVKKDLDLDWKWEDFRYTGPDLEKLRLVFEQFEFSNLMKRFDLKREEKAFKKGVYQAIKSETELKKLCQKLKEAELISVDTETTSLTIHSAQLVGISLSVAEGEAFYIPVGHVSEDRQSLAPGQLDPDLVKKHLKPILEDPSILKMGQNLKYDFQILLNWGLRLQGISADTLIESYLINSDEPHGLDALALKHLGHQNISYEEVTGKGKSQISFAEVSIERATEYSGEDSDIALRLHHYMVPQLKKLKCQELFEQVEVPLISVLGEMEYHGVKVDREVLEAMDNHLSEDQAAVQDKVFELAGGAFNIGSPKQLSQVLFDKLKLPVIRKTKTGISTDESVLQELSKKHAICDWILKYRELSKLKSTYVEGLINQIHPKTGRVHTSFNQTITATGRLSSSNPNLQNIPTTNDPRYDIRSVFIAEKGHELFSGDYSQVELRLLADMSEDQELLRAFSHDEDVHSYTGKLIFGVNEVTPEQRKIAKTINFGVVYGQTPYGLSQTLKISPGEAKDFIDKYFDRYSGVKKFLNSIVVRARNDGYVATVMGRRRYLPEINSANRMRREMAERAAINTPIQGTAADMIKMAMVAIQNRLREQKLASKMILQVHDELVFEVPTAEKKVLESLVLQEMENAMKIKVPLKVDWGWGKSWRECD